MKLPQFNEEDFKLIYEKYHFEFAKMQYSKNFDYYLSGLKRANLIEDRKNEKVLDLACGCGNWSFAFAKYSKEVIGVDISCERLLIAEKVREMNNFHNVKFMGMSGEKLKFPDCSFDVVFCYSAFWMMNEKKAIREIYRVLAPGGIIYISLNDLGWFLERIFIWGKKKEYKKSVKHLLNIIRTFIVRTTGIYSSRSTYNSFNHIYKLLKSNNFINIEKIDDSLTLGTRSDTYFGFRKSFEIQAIKKNDK